MHPWWTFNNLKTKLGRFQFLVLLLSILMCCAYLSFLFGAEWGKWQQERAEQQQQRLDNLYQELDEKVRTINYLSVELEVEQKANSQVKQELVEVRQEAFNLRKELNFYQKVVAPELVADGLAIEQFKVESTNRRNRYRLKFSLVQTDTKQNNAKGYIRLNIVGSLDQQKQTLDLAKLADLDVEKLRFSFSYFQYFEAEFSLEEAFIPEDIEIKVVQPKSRWQSYNSFTQKFEWPKVVD